MIRTVTIALVLTMTMTACRASAQDLRTELEGVRARIDAIFGAPPKSAAEQVASDRTRLAWIGYRLADGPRAQLEALRADLMDARKGRYPELRARHLETRILNPLLPLLPMTPPQYVWLGLAVPQDSDRSDARRKIGQLAAQARTEIADMLEAPGVAAPRQQVQLLGVGTGVAGGLGSTVTPHQVHGTIRYRGGPGNGIRVQLFNVSLGQSVEVWTDDTGGYTFVDVPPGLYRLEATAGRETRGFGVSIQPGPTMELGPFAWD